MEHFVELHSSSTLLWNVSLVLHNRYLCFIFFTSPFFKQTPDSPTPKKMSPKSRLFFLKHTVILKSLAGVFPEEKAHKTQ